MNKIPNRQVICDVLVEEAKKDKDIVVLCSDSRGSASLAPFADTHPEQFVEVGIAEQSLVSIAAGLASCGKKAYAASPACFLSTRSMEQAKVDVAYSNTNVKLIGISGGVSYGALGMTHHSAQDIAIMGSIPNMRVYLPSDRHQTKCLIKALLSDEKPAYIRVGRNPVEDVYSPEDTSFVMNKATVLAEGSDVLVVACGEMVRPALDGVNLLKEKGVKAALLDMYCIKPFDEVTFLKYLNEVKAVVTVEEHTYLGGLGSLVSQITARENPKKVMNLSLPDEPVITGNSKQVFDYYNLNAQGIVTAVMELLV
ncbi:transketolase [Anaerocolumna cellulosilytica]|uniref:Transketolase n=1 Tax=Anaerocolumna cellulosilytica TaxID=433286 RepID=A0A6S6R3Q2_9FIRM|nr:transketolase C-terminal domain-containing protein [Anaerocolumna cellulosilytica]MBB5195456.1 transketolase [Anaerocolumna cellulosilytica]BCJ95989.1 transketolase [Anaerocolumna cellulosilytica]